MSARKTRPGAFTLIELLVVIAIIALLVSILLPSLNQAKELGRAVVCASNLKAMSLAFGYYTDNYDGWLLAPWDNTMGWWLQWPYVMTYYAAGEALERDVLHFRDTSRHGGTSGGPYHPDNNGYRWFPPPAWPFRGVNQSPSMFCPTLVNKKISWGDDPGTSEFEEEAFTSWSMGMIAKDSWGNYSIAGWPKETRLTHPGETVYLMDYSSTIEDDPSGLNAWTYFGCYRINPHLDASNFMFVDGHVERLSSKWDPDDDPKETGELTEYMFHGED
jgi:prepilin-type N-terminal cleavage/methylation domain-containing protein/prepilin-type processing-associated H-X9-DG protein